MSLDIASFQLHFHIPTTPLCLISVSISRSHVVGWCYFNLHAKWLHQTCQNEVVTCSTINHDRNESSLNSSRQLHSVGLGHTSYRKDTQWNSWSKSSSRFLSKYSPTSFDFSAIKSLNSSSSAKMITLQFFFWAMIPWAISPSATKTSSLSSSPHILCIWQVSNSSVFQLCGSIPPILDPCEMTSVFILVVLPIPFAPCELLKFFKVSARDTTPLPPWYRKFKVLLRKDPPTVVILA